MDWKCWLLSIFRSSLPNPLGHTGWGANQTVLQSSGAISWKSIEFENSSWGLGIATASKDGECDGREEAGVAIYEAVANASWLGQGVPVSFHLCMSSDSGASNWGEPANVDVVRTSSQQAIIMKLSKCCTWFSGVHTALMMLMQPDVSIYISDQWPPNLFGWYQKNSPPA